jgi:hypothetical protein
VKGSVIGAEEVITEINKNIIKILLILLSCKTLNNIFVNLEMIHI